MNNGRRVELDVTYNNAPFAGQVGAEIESLTYVDNAADDSDSIDITLDAQDSKWLHGWLPEEGATLRPRIIGRDWNGPGDTHVMECGLFILDDVPNFGQADTITGVRVYDINGALAGQQSISLKRTSLNVALLRFTFPLIETEE